MVALLPLLPLLNATSSGILSCFAQNLPNETQIAPLIYKECREAVASIPMGGKSLAPVTFSRTSEAGFQVPDSWTFGTCTVAIDVVTASTQETATFAAILKRAFDLTVECVIHPPHLGGKSALGKRGGLEVALFAAGIGTCSDHLLLLRLVDIFERPIVQFVSRLCRFRQYTPYRGSIKDFQAFKASFHPLAIGRSWEGTLKESSTAGFFRFSVAYEEAITLSATSCNKISQSSLAGQEASFSKGLEANSCRRLPEED